MELELVYGSVKCDKSNKIKYHYISHMVKTLIVIQSNNGYEHPSTWSLSYSLAIFCPVNV